jgi:hypothetical protein
LVYVSMKLSTLTNGTHDSEWRVYQSELVVCRAYLCKDKIAAVWRSQDVGLVYSAGMRVDFNQGELIASGLEQCVRTVKGKLRARNSSNHLVQTCSFIKSLMTIKQNVTPELIYGL